MAIDEYANRDENARGEPGESNVERLLIELAKKVKDHEARLQALEGP